jgi:Flp pilus assembly protein TadG
MTRKMPGLALNGHETVSDRRGGVSILFAAAAVPMLLLIGLAVDFGIWNEVNASLELAADTAALDAVKIAGNGEVQGDANYIAEGQRAGTGWFAAAVSQIDGTITPTVLVSGTTTVTAQVTYSGTVPSIFGGFFYKILTYPVYGQAAATVTTTPYLNIEIMLDNSSSMEIGASYSDIATLQELTPCSIPGPLWTTAPGAYYNQLGATGFSTSTPPSGQNYNAYTNASGATYDGSLAPPTLFTTQNSWTTAGTPYTFPTWTLAGNAPNGENFVGPSCQGFLPKQLIGTAAGQYPAAGPPCAFACHFDTVNPAGAGYDYYAIARSTVNKPYAVTLRFDTVKAATRQVITAMQTDNLPSINNLAVGVFTFANSLTQVYPAAGAGVAGNDWATAIADVGYPPSVPNGPDTGIQPDASSNAADTNFPGTMTSLAALMTPSGDGSKASTPRKVLFIVSDGLSDYNSTSGRTMAAFDPTYCTNFKNMGFTIYVVYTPYYPLQNGFYLSNLYSVVEGSGTNSLSYNLQACASAPSDYIVASDATQLNNALQAFLKAALSSPARFSS